MLVELQEEKFVYQSNKMEEDHSSKDRCEFCRKYTTLNYPCKCKEVSYCCEICREKDWRYHVRTC